MPLVKNTLSTQVMKILIAEAASRGVLLKEVFLEISQNSQENTCARVSFLMNLPAWGNFIKRETRGGSRGWSKGTGFPPKISFLKLSWEPSFYP